MQHTMRKGWSYVKDSEDFINISCKLPDNAVLSTADIVGFSPSTPHNVGLRALKEALGK